VKSIVSNAAQCCSGRSHIFVYGAYTMVQCVVVFAFNTVKQTFFISIIAHKLRCEDCGRFATNRTGLYICLHREFVGKLCSHCSAVATVNFGAVQCLQCQTKVKLAFVCPSFSHYACVATFPQLAYILLF